MSVGLDALSNRAMSSYPLSIGTSLALESIQIGPNKQYDESRVIPNKVDITKYDVFYINVMTLYRNLVGSVDKLDFKYVLPGNVSQALEQECNVIKEIIKGLSNDKVKVKFYCSKYSGLKDEFPNNLIRKDNTQLQETYSINMQAALNDLISNNELNNIVLFDSKIKNNKRGKALIMTHYAYDLLAYKDFDVLDLLESHTGILKNKTMFYSKLLNGKDLIRIPFNRITYQIFGDKELLSPLNIKVRKLVIELSNTYNWTQVTTQDKIKYSFDQILDQDIKDMLKNLK